MLIIHDPRCAEFGLDPRPEKAARVVEAVALLQSAHREWEWQLPTDAEDETLLLAHTRAHLKRLQEPRDFDEDTPYYEGIYSHARRSVAAALDVTRAALLEGRKSFSLMRPPGHHATAGQAMGFCYLNSVAIAAHAARAMGANRVAVWDFDAHHGNGTEAILDGRHGFLFASVHLFPGYPGTGTRNSANCFNWPIGPHGQRELHMKALEQSFWKVLEFKPELILVSAGFDAHIRDPIGMMTLEAADYATMGRWIREAGVPAASILEGGYSRELPHLIEVYLRALES